MPPVQATLPPATSGADATGADAAGAEDSRRTLIDELFGGELRSTVVCLSCGSVSCTSEPFLDLSLPIPSKARRAAAHHQRGVDGAAAAAGFVNGCGSVGAIGQGFVTYKVVEVCGWEGLFASLAAAMAATAVAVRPALAVEEAAMGGAKASKRVKVA